jgi:hypothetical protein
MMNIKIATILNRMGKTASVLLLCVLAMQWFHNAPQLFGDLTHSVYYWLELTLVIFIFLGMYAGSVIKRKSGG